MSHRTRISANDRDVADSIYRLSFTAFVYRAYLELYGQPLIPNFHIEAICYYLLEMFNGRRPRQLVVNLPPRSLKSFIISVCLPAWLMGLDPTYRTICASYSEILATTFSRRCLDLMETPFYRRLFPGTRLSSRKATALEFETTKHGYRLATSVGGTLTGRGGDAIIVDDPIKAQDVYSELARNSVKDWFLGTALSRLDDVRRSKKIVVMQRLHADDLSGVLIEKGWPKVVFQAIETKGRRYAVEHGKSYWRARGEVLQPKRERIEDLCAIRAERGSHIFEAQYQQNPIPLEGNLIKASWLKRYDLTKPPEFQHVLIGCDPAGKASVKSDYTAIVAVGLIDRQLYLLDAIRGHWTVREMQQHLLEFAQRWPYSAITVEETASGAGLVQLLKEDLRIDVRGVTPKNDKETRLLRQLAKFECGRISFPEDAPWLPMVLHEVLAFPNGRYDDLIDALLLVLEWFDETFAYYVNTSGIVIPSMPRGDDIFDQFSNRGWSW